MCLMTTIENYWVKIDLNYVFLFDKKGKRCSVHIYSLHDFWLLMWIVSVSSSSSKRIWVIGFCLVHHSNHITRVTFLWKIQWYIMYVWKEISYIKSQLHLFTIMIRFKCANCTHLYVCSGDTGKSELLEKITFIWTHGLLPD